MQANPQKNRVFVDEILLEQFRRKGYNCKEIKEVNATIFLIIHPHDHVRPPLTETYKKLLKSN